jgi:hypothetical protein
MHPSLSVVHIVSISGDAAATHIGRTLTALPPPRALAASHAARVLRSSRKLPILGMRWYLPVNGGLTAAV